MAPQLLWLTQEIERVSLRVPHAPIKPVSMIENGNIYVPHEDPSVILPSQFPGPSWLPYSTAVVMEAEAALAALGRIQDLFGSFNVWCPYSNVVDELRTLAELSQAWRLENDKAEQLIRRFTVRQLKLSADCWLYALEALVATENESRGWRYWRHAQKPFAWVSTIVQRHKADAVRMKDKDALYAKKADYKAHRADPGELEYDVAPGRGWVSLNNIVTGKYGWDGKPLEFEELVPCPWSLGQLERDLLQHDFEKALSCAPARLRHFLEMYRSGIPQMEIARTLDVPDEYRHDVLRYFERGYAPEMRMLQHILRPYQQAQCGPTIQEFYARGTPDRPDGREQSIQTSKHDGLGIQRSEIWRGPRHKFGHTATGLLGAEFHVRSVLDENKPAETTPNPNT
jgi:DNA-directed RNA polymerase specialized sigma24 family protein